MVSSSSALGVKKLDNVDKMADVATQPIGRDALAVLANYSPDIPVDETIDDGLAPPVAKKSRHPFAARRQTRLAPLHETAVMSVAFVGLLAGYFAWRLSDGTISISAATPLVENALERVIGGDAEIGSLRLGWDKDARTFLVTADQITAKTAARATPLTLGQVTLTLNAQGLLLGQTQISRAQISGLSAVLVVDKDGATAFGFGTVDEVLKLPRKKQKTRDLRSILDSARQALLLNNKNGRVDAIGLRDAQFTIIDPSTGERLTLIDAQANVTADASNVIAIQASGRVREMDGHLNVAIASEADPKKRPAVAARFGNVSLARLPASLRVGPLARLANDTARISGLAQIKLGHEAATSDFQANVQLSNGQLQGYDISRASAQIDWKGGPFRATFSDVSASGALGQVDGAQGQITQSLSGTKTMTFGARRFSSAASRANVVFGTNVNGSATISGDNVLTSGILRGDVLSFVDGQQTFFRARDANLTMSPANGGAPRAYKIALNANGLDGKLKGDEFGSEQVKVSVLALPSNNGVRLSQIAGNALTARVDFALAGMRQSIDATGLVVDATGFSSNHGTQGIGLGAVNFRAADMVFGRRQNALFSGSARGVDIRAADALKIGGRYQGTIGRLAARTNRGLGMTTGGEGIALDVTQTEETGGTINRFDATTISFGAGEGMGHANNFALTGRFNGQALVQSIVSAKSVEITHQSQLARPFWADDLRVSGDFTRRSATLDAFYFRHRGVILEGETQIALAPRGSPKVDLTAEVRGPFSVEILISAWPKRFLPETRGNIAQLIPAGTAEVSKLALAIPAGMMKKQVLPRNGMTLDFALRDVTVSYLRGMSDITGASGQGQLRGDSLSITLPQGRIGDIELTQGRVDIPQFMPGGGHAIVSARASGDVSAMAQEIDLPPLALLTKAGLTPDRLSGTGSALVNLDIPLKRQLQGEEIRVQVDGAFEQAGLTRAFAGLDAYNGSIRLGVENQKVDVSGLAWLAGNLFEFDWLRGAPAATGSQVSLNASGLVTIESLQAIGIDARDYAQGPFQIDVESRSQDSNFGEASLVADFSNTTIKLPGNVWSKAADLKATASAKLYPREGGGWNVQELRFDADGARLRGALDITDDAKLVDARFSRVMIDNTADISLDVTPSAQALTVTMRGAFLNLSPYLNQKNVSERAVDLLDRPLTLSADIGRVTTAPDRELTNVHADIVRDTEGWRTFEAAGSAPAGRSQISLMMQRDGRRTISGILSDAGFFAQLLYPGAPVFGGTGTIEGELPVVGANSSGRLTFAGKDIELRRQGTSPIFFDQVDLPMSVAGGIVTLRDGQAGGDAYTVKASGYVDVGEGRLDIRGVATPGGLNRVLADIPLFGAILGGGADEGLLGLTFTARGSLDTPRLQANPISALAPGFLRKLFESEAPLSPQPRLVVPQFIGLPLVQKWPYGPTEDMSEAARTNDAVLGPAQ
jgi:Protein of unknown function